MTSPTDALRNLAGHSLQQFASHVAELVLDPSATLDTLDLAALKATRQTLVDLAFLANNRSRATRGSAHTQAEVVGRTSAFSGHGTSEATALLKRLDHHLALLDRMHGPQAVEVRVEKCELPHEHEGEGASV